MVETPVVVDCHLFCQRIGTGNHCRPHENADECCRHAFGIKINRQKLINGQRGE